MSKRSNYWATIVYDLEVNKWLPILDDFVIPCAISPLHDKDDVKPHYHVLVAFSSLKSRGQADELFSSIGGVGCELVRDVRAYTRYLTHENSEKHPYDRNDVFLLHGFPYDDLIELKGDKYFLLETLTDIIVDNGFIHYIDVLTYVRLHDRSLIRVVMDNVMFLKFLL